MNRKNMAIVVAALLALGLLVWAVWPEAKQVETARLTRGDFVRELVEDAQTRVRERYTVAAPVAGQLVRPRVKPGDEVRAGQTVAEVWPAASALLDARSQGEQAERVAAMQATRSRAQANLARARAAEQQARAEHERIESLAAQAFVSPAQQDNARLTLQQRQQEQLMAARELDTAEHDLQRLRIGLRQPGGSGIGPLWKIQAPAAGRVLKLHRESEGPVTAGTPLLDLGDPARLEIVTELLTEEAAALPPQARATLAHWGGEGVLQARLSRVEPGGFTKVSALGVEEQRVKAVFDWEGTAPQGLGDGFKMEIRIVVQQAPGVLLAPVSSVFPQGARHAVFVVVDGRTRQHPVELLGRNGQQAWLRSDLPEGTVLVSYPPATLREGDRVKPLKP